MGEPSQNPVQERPNDAAPATLGDVLYADNPAAESEKRWVGLVHAMAAGDQLALYAIYERTHRPVFRLIMRIVRNQQTAEEVTLDVFHGAWKRASRYDAGNGTVLGWIMNQARSRAIDRLRFEQRQKRVDPDAGAAADEASVSDASDLLLLQEQGRLLREAMALLTPDERKVIEAAYFSGLTYAEVAKASSLPLGTVKTRVRSGLQKLRQALAGKRKDT